MPIFQGREKTHYDTVHLENRVYNLLPPPLCLSFSHSPALLFCSFLQRTLHKADATLHTVNYSLNFHRMKSNISRKQ